MRRFYDKKRGRMSAHVLRVANPPSFFGGVFDELRKSGRYARFGMGIKTCRSQAAAPCRWKIYSLGRSRPAIYQHETLDVRPLSAKERGNLGRAFPDAQQLLTEFSDEVATLLNQTTDGLPDPPASLNKISLFRNRQTKAEFYEISQSGTPFVYMP